MYNIIK